ncbi:MAG: nucleoside hydrolase, partial [Planctomycetota bacterium]
MSDPVRLIIDTDPGVDDALAIMLAHAHPGVHLEALTVVHGNVGLEQTTQNAFRILDVLDAEALVYAGCDRPLIYRPAENAARVHGEDGLGDVAWPASDRPVATEHAAAAIVRMATESPGELTLVAIGPLTNVAMALRLDPTLPEKIGRFVVMGGAVTGQGNVLTGCAEFNVYTDPEAARIVFEEWPDFELVDWEATLRHGYPAETVDGWRDAGDDRAAFYHAISGRVRIGRAHLPSLAALLHELAH